MKARTAILSAILLCTASSLHAGDAAATAPAGHDQPAAASDAAKPAPGPLDGTRWEVKVTPDAAAAARGEKEFPDTLDFAAGKVEMSECVKVGFLASEYSTRKQGEQWIFHTVQKSEKQGVATWDGEISGESVKGTLVTLKPDGTSLRYSFEGKKAR